MRHGVLLLAFCCLRAQDFEVASVKPAGEAASMIAVKKSAGGLASRYADPILFSRRSTLASLLVTAYRLKPQQVVGPPWLAGQRYDIEGRDPEGATADQQLVMLQHRLVDQFQLKLHRENREMPIHEGKDAGPCRASLSLHRSPILDRAGLSSNRRRKL